MTNRNASTLRRIAFQCVIERTLNIELPDALREDRIVCHFNDAWVLKEIEKAPLRDQVGDFRIASQRDNLWMLSQFARTGNTPQTSVSAAKI